MDANIARERATHPKPTVLSDFILGSQDGIVNVLGIILGLSAATRDVRIILVATLAALGAESIAMGAVAYTSTRARAAPLLEPGHPGAAGDEGNPENGTGRGPRHPHRVGLQGRRSRGDRGADLPQPDRGARIHDVLRTEAVPVEAGAPRASAFLVGTATVVGHFIPLSPFFLVGSDVLLGAVLAILLSGVALFGIGWYEAKITVGSWWREGLEMLLIGLGGGVAGYVIGRLVGAA